MAKKIQYLDKQGLTTLVKEIKKRSTNVYTIKGNAVYADEAYLTTDAATTNGIDSVGLWQDINGTWTKITEVKAGWVFNIDNDFNTDADFIEGAGSKVVAGINIVAVNLGDDVTPNMKWDLLAMGVSLEEYQTKKLLTAYGFPVDETVDTYDDLPDTEYAVDGKLYLVNDARDLYLATIPLADAAIVEYTKIGNLGTVEGALETISNTAPNTPITDAEIEALFNE